VLLTPGNTTPMDIKNPDSMRNVYEKLATVVLVPNLFSKSTNEIPNINVIIVNRRYLGLNVCSEFTFFTSTGILPRIRPIKQKLVGAGKVLNKVFKIFPNKNTPIIPPSPIGKRYRKFFLKSLNKFEIESISLSYIPIITQITPLLIPGSIAPAPSRIPIKKLKILATNITNK
jgi:hypothetical protein